MHGNKVDETHIQTWYNEVKIQRWFEELLDNAIRDCVSTLHFEISGGARRIRQRKSSAMSMVADDLSPENYNRFIAVIKSRFDVDPAETRREQYGMDDLGLRAVFNPAQQGLHCCIDFRFQNKNHESWLKFDSADADQLLLTLEKRRGLVFVFFNRLDWGEWNVANWQILKTMADVFDGQKVVFAPWSTEKIITTPKVLYTMPMEGESCCREWFEGLFRQQPDALFLPLDRRLPISELCRYAEEHLVMVEVSSANFPIYMPFPGSWLRRNCAGLLMMDSQQRVCQACRKFYTPSPAELRYLKLKTSQTVEFSRGQGCEVCAGRGVRGKQLSVTLAADGVGMASLFESFGTPDYNFWKTTSPAIRHRRAQLVKAGLVPSYPTLAPEYWVEEIFDLDKLT